ncbi:uncharacterized protein LOC120111038 [Phoenix dactylifera]|uniref:Uncharacterized protein LOC120111038 n=1 Tax=Phoenix dactylifera TaxID=42345 RepID=A0A8B9AH27_PHODC|nr:uncharacterized protein LOC120111038 [Phoenix dactylifera]
MSVDRNWMYHRLSENGYIRAEFCDGVKGFLEFAFTQLEYCSGDKIRCPCIRCDNQKFLNHDTVNVHLLRKGFTPRYSTWFAHGELLGAVAPVSTSAVEASTSMDVGCEHGQQYRTMVMEAMGPEEELHLRSAFEVNHEEEPNKDAADFYSLLKDAEVPLWEGCKKHSKLSAISQLLNCKSEFNMSISCYDRIMKIVKNMLPESEKLPSDFYQSKKMLRKLGLEYTSIDVCENNCMLFYKETENLIECTICGHPRYKLRRNDGGGRRKDVPYRRLRYLPITPRLQRLFMSSRTAELMSWHVKGGDSDEMVHPACGEAWKHFDRIHPSFSTEPRNVRLGLCTDGFNPFSQSARPYSCWPVFVTVYNLPPSICMKRPYIFLSLVISGPKSPGKSIDVLLRPLIDELKILWEVGVTTYDIFRKENFQMKAVLLWTINDFPAYGMLSGWSTHGKLACPYCMENSKTFTLQHGGKTSFFDCHRQFLPMDHAYRYQVDSFFNGRIETDPPPRRLSGEELKNRISALPNITFGLKAPKHTIPGFGKDHNWVKRSIFWELPYWHTLLIRHNLDVMHIVRNVFLNIFYTCMDVKGKTKDNVKARQDLELYCKRPKLRIQFVNGKLVKPPASYVLSKDQAMEVCEWVKGLRLPDGYASNISKCVNLDDYKFYGLKSHDCHVFMLRLLPIAFREVLPAPVWDALTELSCYFRDLCSTTLRVQDMEVLEKNIVVTLCKLEKIFSPAFFDSMEHLPVHLAYEAKVGGPVQYRWMYPFERLMHDIKQKVKNRASIEGSIVEAYIIEEISTFCSHYFEPSIQTRLNQVPRNEDEGEFDLVDRLSIFTHQGRPFGKPSARHLTTQEFNAAELYVLLNCVEVQPFGK